MKGKNISEYIVHRLGFSCLNVFIKAWFELLPYGAACTFCNFLSFCRGEKKRRGFCTGIKELHICLDKVTNRFYHTSYILKTCLSGVAIL